MPPPTIEEAVRLGIQVEMIRNTATFNVYGLPTISIPCGFTSSGLPIGMPISGPRFGEANVRRSRSLTASNRLARKAAPHGLASGGYFSPNNGMQPTRNWHFFITRAVSARR